MTDRKINPEEQLRLLVGRQGADASAVAALVAGGLDWETLAALAAVHGCGPLLAQRMRGMPLPPDSARQLAIGELTARIRSERIVAEALRFTGALSDRGVRSAVYKGPVAAQRYYGDAALRDYGDFDVLVRHESLPIVDEVAREQGYTLLLYPDSDAQAHNRRTGLEEPWVSSSGAVLDLHWSVADEFFPIGLRTDELLERSVVQALPGGEVRTFSDEDHLIVLAAHAAKHRFARLEWLVSVAEAASRPDLDWNAIVERSQRARCSTAVVVAFRLAERLLGYPFPPLLESLRVRRKDVEAMVDGFAMSMFGRGRPPLLPFRLFDRRVDALRAAWLMVFSPRPADLTAMPLSPRWRAAHYLLRPFRLVGKYARRALGKRG